MAPGEIWIARFPFGGSAGFKMRPIVLLTGPVGTVPEFLAAYVSSAIPNPLLPSDIVIDPSLSENAPCNLSLKSVIRLHKLATVHRRDIAPQLEHLSTVTWLDVMNRLRTLLNL
jgi:hypothetical protein